MIDGNMKITLTSRALFGILFIIAALVGTPIAIYQLQQQQEIRQRADTTIAWATDESAISSCPTNGNGAIITVTFSNTEPDRSSYSMDVTATDRQTGKSVDMGSIRGGQTKSAIIQTGRRTLNAGTVDFDLTWTDGHRGTDDRQATYRSISNCVIPSPTPSPIPSVTPKISPSVSPPMTPKPSTSVTPSPSPTICPTMAPVKNVRIDCPNCP